MPTPEYRFCVCNFVKPLNDTRTKTKKVSQGWLFLFLVAKACEAAASQRRRRVKSASAGAAGFQSLLFARTQHSSKGGKPTAACQTSDQSIEWKPLHQRKDYP